MDKTIAPNKFYEARINALKIEESEQLRWSRLWVTLRLFSFLAIPGVIWFFLESSWVVLFAILALIVFLFCVRKSIENKEKLQFIRTLIQFNFSEMKALNGDYTDFITGYEWIDTKHPYTYDLDVFGEKSIYQFLNRCVSKAGEELLANRLKGEIIGNSADQEAIEELSNHIEWGQRFRASNISENKSEEPKISLSEWIKQPHTAPKIYNFLRFVLPAIGWTLSLLYYFDIIDGFLLTIGALVVLFPTFQRLKETNKSSRILEELETTIQAIQKQNDLLHQLDVYSPLLNQLKTEAKTAAKELKLLELYCKRAGQRNNVLVGILLNFLFAWDVRLNFDLAKWKIVHVDKAAIWEKNVTEIEVLMSGATFRFNQRTSTCFAQIVQNQQFEIQAMGHPLILSDNRVTNDFVLTENELFTILTGPNMAGKSTFLRSLGVNYVLAKAGFPVVAKKFLAPELNLYSSMRNTDDLSSETSYFHAELLRLRFIVDAIEKNGEHVFIILDEILKGTNSKDKEEGSAMFLRKLCTLNARGIIATHDLKLTDLAENNPHIINRYFDSNIEGGEMSFDYQIRDGVAQNMNASFLLRKMGLSE